MSRIPTRRSHSTCSQGIWQLLMNRVTRGTFRRRLIQLCVIRSNPSVANQIFVGDLNGANFDPSKSTKFLVHGFAAQAFNSWPMDFKDGK
jgi:hypothetical protein